MRYKMEAMVMRIQVRRCYTLLYIPINVISLDTVDFTECDPMLRITTLWFSQSVSPLSETDDVVHNVFLNTQCMRYCDIIHIAPYKICSKYFFRFIMITTNPTSKHKHIFLMHLERFLTQNIVRIKILTIVLFKYAFL